ncbi:MAG: hypothetical protein HY280_11220 [Nitrospinae bacterium]|nr:hypothetical protein [Nitrospinota bacterium]
MGDMWAKLPLKRVFILLLAPLLLVACSGGGSGGAGSTGVVLSGTVSNLAPSSKPKSLSSPRGSGTNSSFAGGTLQVLDSTGKVIATATIASDGSYSVGVTPGSNYVLRAVKGNVCLKAIIYRRVKSGRVQRRGLDGHFHHCNGDT